MRTTFRFMTFLLIVCLGTFITAPLMAADFDLQDAVENALAGDTVTVPAGTYAVNLVIDKSINLVADGEVTLTRPWTDYDTEYHDTILVLPSQTEEVVHNPEDMPVITCLDSGAVTIDGFAFAQPVSGDLSGEYWQGEYTTIGILAGSGVDLTVNNCTVGADFFAPVVVTTWEDVFTQALGNVDYLYTANDFSMGETSSSLAMSNCNFSDYDLAGVVLLGEGVTAEINNNTLNGDDVEEKVVGVDANMAMQEVAELGLNAVSGSLFANDVYLPATGVGVLVINSNSDQVIMEGNTLTHNLAAVAAIKEVSQSENTSILRNQAAVEAGEGLSIESGNTFTENILGVVALGGLDVLLEWNVVSTDLLISPDIAWESTSAMPLFIQDADFTNNIVGTILAGKVKATVDDNLYSGDLAADLVGIGDLSESYVTGNEFKGTIGASMVFALQKADIEGALEILEYPGTIEEGSLNIDQQGTLTVSGNTITGNGPIENAHEFLFGPEPVVEQAMSLGQRTADYGPLAVLPLVPMLDDDDDGIGLDDISLAGIVLLDGARNISIEGNTIAGTILGITAIDTGILEDIQKVDITDNTVEGNICGLTLVGAGQILVPMAEYYVFSPKDFMSVDNKLVLGEVSGNSFSSNHIGMISALSVEGEIHDNFFDDNALLGMAHIGVGDWLLYELFYGAPFDISGDICPTLDINTNSISGNGANLEDRPAILDEDILEGITAADFLCGGALILDAAQGVKLTGNNIEGNGNFGVLATARAVYDPSDLQTTEVTSIDEAYTLDASSNWWGNADGPSSYAISDDVAPGAEEEFFLDPDNGDPADGSGDSLGSFLVGYGDVYFPFSLTEPFSSSAEIEVLFLEKENTIKFSDWSETPYEINAAPRSSGGGFCGVASFTPSLLLLLAPLAFMLRRK